MTTTLPFRVLTVCTGNICRSPMAERLLQSELDIAAPNVFAVESAGTAAMVGSDMEPHIEGFVRVLGASSEGFAARQLTREILDKQDLVLALTREHRSRIVEIHPGLLKKTFTLRELARVLPHIDGARGVHPAERWELAIPLAMRSRTLHRAAAEDDDVVDPYRRGDKVFEEMRQQLVPAVQALVAWEKAHA
ncbi:low molecular weight phosphatase family protein [Arthrobacter sp. H35-D1]|uniref:arsenate reductase/protein-tyrosine-phosphatase family protein n=1 Tax=Arthrobacter sp. H35-D1 TaxID=3046202 RepID=UPI0024B9B417|nr:low molecular weight phosphatase family protein [Arthrobacter sp. H35-D1]MDJ0313992.1 low molecular weight phosphatase family protein [Arthrobacter sp. H35-D1]